MKINISKEWLESRIHLEDGCSIEAGNPNFMNEPPKYDPVQSLQDEVDRFFKTNEFTPMLVTNFYAQARVVLSENERLRIERDALKMQVNSHTARIQELESYSQSVARINDMQRESVTALRKELIEKEILYDVALKHRDVCMTQRDEWESIATDLKILLDRYDVDCHLMDHRRSEYHTNDEDCPIVEKLIKAKERFEALRASEATKEGER